MLEKIGLPAKPSLRGSNWVVDASHCQGCCSQFTFINRKHHCRRCGGLFCNSCTQQRMLLRGQGDSPVRICDPCKKLEEAARFEMRHGYKNRSSRGSSRASRKPEDEILCEVLDNDVNESSLSASTSCLNKTVGTTFDAEAETLKAMSSATPDELRQQALEEKKRYKTLKGEGKSDEALRAFKRGKELERQAEAIDLSIRKNRRKTITSRSVSESQSVDGGKESSKRRKSLHEMGKESDGFAAELKALGWSDDEDKKSVALSLEGELASLLQSKSDQTDKDRHHQLDKTPVNVLKRKALALKRQGKLAEAKEELKQAKILEKQLEEQELLAGADDSDDELSRIIHSMGNDNKDDLSLHYDQGTDFDVHHLFGTLDDLGDYGDSEVTEEDTKDPEIMAALRSLGWIEESGQSEIILDEPAFIDRDAKQAEIQLLKREAVNKKREGNVSEAMALLKKAKLLERELEGLNAATGTSSKLVYMTGNSVYTMEAMDSKQTPKNKLAIQKELLALKKKALALRREGRLEEAEEELKKGKVLQDQIDELENLAKGKAAAVTSSSQSHGLPDEHIGMPGEIYNHESEVDVTDQDMNDPRYLSLLKNLGWEDENCRPDHSSSEILTKAGSQHVKTAEVQKKEGSLYFPSIAPRRSKAEIQRELLGLKRKALSLKRLGKAEEAEEVLKTANTLEAQMADMEATKNVPPAHSKEGLVEVNEYITEGDMHDPTLLSELKNLGWAGEVADPEAKEANPMKTVSEFSTHSISPSEGLRSKTERQRQLLALKRKALVYRPNGKTEEAEKLQREATVREAPIAAFEAPKEHVDASAHVKSGNPEPSLNDEKYMELNNKIMTGKSSIPPQNCSGASDDQSLGESADVSVVTPYHLAEDKHTLFYACISSDMDVPSNLVAAKGASITHPCQSGNVVDYLTGIGCSNSQAPAEIPNTTSDLGCSMTPKEETQKREGHALVKRALSDEEGTSQTNPDTLREKIVAQKKRAVALKREGKLAEAREELRKAKLLERSLEGDSVPQRSFRDDGLSKSSATSEWKESNTSNLSQEPLTTWQRDSSSNLAGKPQASKYKEGVSSNSDSRPLSARDRLKLQQESLGHKRQALKLRREGRLQEAEAELEMAKSLEIHLEESSGHEWTGPERVDDVVVEDFLDPQLLSALKAIGLDDVDDIASTEKSAASRVKTNAAPQAPRRSDVLQQSPGGSGSPEQERIQLEGRIRAEKVKAVNLKREGKQAEALDALRRAKLYEKKLISLFS